MAAENKKEPRLVQIGLNVIALLDVDDKSHTFEAIVLMHVFWDASPLYPGTEFFRPWIQLHNARTVEDMDNKGMTQWENADLAEKVRNNGEGKPCNVMESRNFVAQFVSELNLRNFPFDHQYLRITVMSNMTKDTTFSHKVPRDPQTRVAKPGRTADGDVINTIKCNLEGDTLSEWSVTLNRGASFKVHKKAGESNLASVKYDFLENDKKYSAEGAVYQRLDFYLCTERELKNMMVSIILPSFLLSLASLSCFSLEIEANQANRLSVLFTIILTIIANQFVSQGRLPYLAYFTWMDACLLALQFYVYAVVIETCIVIDLAPRFNMTPDEADLVAFYVFIALFAGLTLVGTTTAAILYFRRARLVNKFEIEGRESFEREEKRLRKLWFPNEVNEAEEDEGIIAVTEPKNEKH